MSKLKKPNQKEINQLAGYLYDIYRDGPFDVDLEESKLMAKNAYAAVFDDYITDTPVYSGKVMSVVWSGAPEFYEVFIWENGEIKSLGQDPHFQAEKDADKTEEAKKLPAFRAGFYKLG